MGNAKKKLQGAGRVCAPYPGGATVCEGGVKFVTVVPEQQEAALILYHRETKEVREILLPIEQRQGDLASVCLEGLDAAAYEYNFRIGDKLQVDAYAKTVVTGADGSLRGRIVPTQRLKAPGQPRSVLKFEEMILYKLHVRGFTRHSSSKVRDKGTFRGVIEKIPYLKELGINAVLLMPAYEFLDTLPEDEQDISRSAFRRPAPDGAMAETPKNYWGYGPAYYFAPKASYAAGDDPTTEFREMTKALHEAGIEVIMEFYFVPGTNPHLITDCLRFWADVYDVDGFQLNENVVPMRVVAADPSLSRKKILSNGFDMSGMYERPPALRTIAECNDGFMVDMRRFLKGDEEQLSAFLYRTKRNPREYGVVNYIANHNGFTLMDLVSYDAKHNEANGENNKDGTDYNFSWNCGAEGKTRRKQVLALRKRQIKNALVLVFLSQGTPMLLSGDECGNSQNGNNNCYCQDNETGWMNWRTTKQSEFIFPFVKQLIEIRQSHPILHMPEEMRMMDYQSCGYPDMSCHSKQAWYPDLASYNRQVGVMYCGTYAGEDEFFYIAYNMHWIPHEFALPTLPKGKVWKLLLSTGEEKEAEIEKKMLTVSDRTTMILISADTKPEEEAADDSAVPAKGDREQI